MAPAGRPRKPENRDLAPGVYRRTRKGKTRYYDSAGRALGTDRDRAALSVAEDAVQFAELAGIGTWQHASLDYRRSMERGEQPLAHSSVLIYKSALNTLDKFFGAKRLDDIRPLHIGTMMRETRAQPEKGNRLLAVISNVWRHARRLGFTETLDPAAGIGKHRIVRAKRHVEDAWLAAIAAEGDQVLRDYIALAITAGPRVRDCLALRRENVVGDELQLVARKNGQPVRLRMAGDLKRVVDELLTRPRKVSGPYLIQTPAGRAVSYEMIKERWNAARDAAQAKDPSIPHLTPMSTRRKSATDEQDGAQDRLGHKREDTTRRHYIARARLADGGVLPAGILDENPNREPHSHVDESAETFGQTGRKAASDKQAG